LRKNLRGQSLYEFEGTVPLERGTVPFPSKVREGKRELESEK